MSLIASQPDPIRVLHYAGNVVPVDKSHAVGPDMDGGFWKAIGDFYDSNTNQTTVQFLPVPPKDWTPEMILKRSKQMATRQRNDFRLSMLNPRRRKYVTTTQQATEGSTVDADSGDRQEGGGEHAGDTRRTHRKGRAGRGKSHRRGR